MTGVPADLSVRIGDIARRASELTGVDLSEIERELEPTPQPGGGWLVRFTGPSSQVREAVEQAISEMKA